MFKNHLVCSLLFIWSQRNATVMGAFEMVNSVIYRKVSVSPRDKYIYKFNIEHQMWRDGSVAGVGLGSWCAGVRGANGPTQIRWWIPPEHKRTGSRVVITLQIRHIVRTDLLKYYFVSFFCWVIFFTAPKHGPRRLQQCKLDVFIPNVTLMLNTRVAHIY